MKKLLTSLILFIVLGIILNSLGILNPNFNSVKQPSTPSASAQSTPTSEGSIEPVEDVPATFLTSWTLQTSDANASVTPTFDHQEISVVYPGTSLASAQLYRDGVPFLKGSHYVLTASITSTIARNVEVEFVNADTGEVYAKHSVMIQGETPIRLEFTMNNADQWNGRLVFNVGNDNSKEMNNEHTITISTIRLRNTTLSDNTIKVNQIGYAVNNTKKAIFPYNQGDMFDVVNVDTKEIVYTGPIVNGLFNLHSGETNFTGNFSTVKTPGKYRIEAQIVGTSYEFEIGDELFTNLSNDLLKFFTYQRCAFELDPAWAFKLAHAACHDTAAIVYDDNTRVIDVNGGWHDAGDYGRYVKTGTKSVNDLMLAYYANPTFFKDNVGIPESGNGIADILDESRFELEWLMKMQADWGGVYNKAVTQGFPGDISPDEDLQRIHVLPAESATTADFISTMAIASFVYKDVDKTFADACLDKAKKAWANLMNTPEQVNVKNPSDFVAGEYRDDKDTDERYFAGMAMFYATHDQQYLDYAKQNYEKDTTAGTGTSWSDVGGYGSYLYLICPATKIADEFYKQVSTDFQKQADHHVAVIQADGYQTSLENYAWGSNGYVANNGIQLLFAYDVFKMERYKQGAVEQANYLLGKNPLNMTFVSGYGKNSPVNMHSRLAKAKNSFLKGALVGGPNNDREDTVTVLLHPDTPPAKVYVDDYLSYSSNEVAIYWNSALIYILSRIE